MSKESKLLIQALEMLEAEKGIDRQIIKEALETALELAYKKNYEQAQNVEVNVDIETGDIKVFSVKEVVETNYDSTLEISLDEARKIHRAYEIGDKIKFEVTPSNFGRIATQTAKHVVMQRIREAERDIIFNDFIGHEDEIISGTVERVDNRFVYVNLGKVEAVMPVREQIKDETFEMDQRIQVYVTKVEKTTRGPQIVVSRAHPDFLKRLFEKEVPEIYSGDVEIMSIAREAGDRSKVAVRSHDPNIDPVGTCVGQGGQRVQSIVNELHGENMDIIEYSDDPATYIKNAMNPAEVVDVVFGQEDNEVTVIVPDYQLSLAIGKRGQNARLAARLTSYKIDIKSESDYAMLQEQAQVESDIDTVTEDEGMMDVEAISLTDEEVMESEVSEEIVESSNEMDAE